MNITINIPTLKEQVVLDSLGYKSEIEQPDGSVIPNPQTGQQWIKQYLVSVLKSQTMMNLRQKEIDKIVVQEINIT